MKIVNLFYVGLAFTVFSAITGCSFNNPQSGDVDEMSNFIKGVVVDSENTSVADADVIIKNIIFTADGIEIIEEKKVKTDANGYFEIKDLENNKYTLFAEYEKSSHIIGRVELTGDSLEIEPVKITNTATVIGRVLGEEPVSVSIAGLSQTAQTNADGIYTLDNIPTGKFDLIFTNGDYFNVLHVQVPPIAFLDTIYIRDVELFEFSDASYNFFESKEIAVSSINAVRYPRYSLPQWYIGKDLNNAYYIEDNNTVKENKTDYLGRPIVLIDDFEFDTLIPNIDTRRGGDQFGVGWFFFYNSAEEDNPGSRFLPEGLIENKKRALSKENAFRGQSFSVEMLLSCRGNLPYAGFGLRFDDYYDMSNLEEISFYAKGEGELLLSIWTKAVFEYPSGENWGHFGHSFELNQDWQLFTLSSENFVPRSASTQEADSLMWGDASEFVSGIEFIAQSYGDDTVSVSLDDIRFVGTKFIKNSDQ